MAQNRTLEFMRALLFGNMVAKLMALAMALALWLFAYNFSYAQPISVRVPVRLPPHEGWAVNTTQTVDMDIIYPRRFQSQVEQAYRSGAVYVQVNPKQVPIEDAGPDEQTANVTLDDNNLVADPSYGIRIQQYRPRAVEVHYVREMTRSLRVIPRVSEPPADYQIAGEPYCIPSTVRVRGPKNIIAAAKGIETDLIDITGPSIPNLPEYPVDVSAQLAPYVDVGKQRYEVTLAEPRVQCRIYLNRASVERTFDNVPIQLLEPPDYPYVAAFREGEGATSVRVRGPASVANSLKPENIVLFVDVRGLKPMDLYHTTPIEADIVRTPNADQLSITLGTPDRAVRISDAAKKP